jgi:adenylate kinase
MNVILFGPPGAGKGTQADNIARVFNLHKVSTGDLLRDEIKNKTDLGKKIKSIVDKGLFVPDSVINNLIINPLSHKKFYNRLIFDGYPRNLNQAKNLDLLIKKHDQKISYVFSLNVDKELLIKRILGRQTCTNCGSIFNEYFRPSTNKNHTCGTKFLVKRSEDNEKTILYRFQAYLDKTLPILDFYKKLNLLHQINGRSEIDQIFKEICAIMGFFET